MKTQSLDLFRPRILWLRAIPLALLLGLASTSTEASGFLRSSGDDREDITALTGPLDELAQPGPGTYRRNLRHDGEDRFFLIYVPKQYQPGTSVPMVMNFHGGGGSPNAAIKTTGFNALADEHGFIVVYPAGTSADNPEKRLSWNILISETYATAQGKDDLGFVRALLDETEALFAIDTQRIYATGMSQGGMLCYRIACDPDLSKRIAAIAPVSSLMTVAPDACNASRPLPVMHFHGADDEFVPFEGGIGPKLRRLDPVERTPVMDTIRFWVAHNNLNAAPREEGQTGEATFTAFGDRGAPGETILWKLGDAGHTWPGGEALLPAMILGNTSKDINASATMWEFFQRHSLD